MKAPIAEKINKELITHGNVRIDPYFWMNQKDNPKVIEYLNAENDYADFVMKPTENLQEELYEEMKARYKKDDQSLPYFFNQYWYIVKYIKGNEYPIFCRKHKTLEAKEEVLINVNTLAKDKSYMDVASVIVSPDNKCMCYSEDTLGRRIYTLKFKNIETGEILTDEITNTTGKIVWANDNQHIFYIRKDDTLRAFKVFRHQIGTSEDNDVLIFHEKDDAFDVNVYKSKSLEYIFIASSSTTSDEHRFIPADNIHANWRIVQPREEDLEYAIEHYEDKFYILTNADDATNFKLVTTEVKNCGMEHWKDLIPHREDVLLEGFELFKKYLVLEERYQGLLQIKIMDYQAENYHYLPFSEETYSAYIGINMEFDTTLLRFGYTSLTTPNSTYEYDMLSQKMTLLKKQEITGGKFDESNYTSKRIWAPSRDGNSLVPISLVYHKNTPINSNTPLLLYGYGSYGHTIDPGFSRTRLSILDRGFVFAIAHVRGGEYLGREWYDNGRLLDKKNTFYDFIDAAEHVIEQGYTSPQHLYAMGGSAGGMLVGAVMNMKPELFNGIIAQVPFVDVVTTMLDEDIPLTTGEYEEWGNPNEEPYYDYMLSYSPYDNIEKKDYPNLLITTGLHDSQVQYWEPAKWTAKLRDYKTNNNVLVFKTDMNAGHGGPSGRFECLKEDALEYAFLLHLEQYEQHKRK